MIAADQPNCFSSSVLVRFSSKDDGTMLNRNVDRHAAEVVKNRQRFCQLNHVSYDDMVYQIIRYGNLETYDKLVDVTELDTTKHTDGVAADGLFTDQPGVGLFLPVADCIATVVYDPKSHSLAVLHMGRHSTLSGLIERTAQRFIRAGSSPEDMLVYMSPSAQFSSYKLQWFEAKNDLAWQDFYEVKNDEYYLDMQGYNKAQFMRQGVPAENIYISDVDTITNQHYFSHANGETGGRSALFAILR